MQVHPIGILSPWSPASNILPGRCDPSPWMIPGACGDATAQPAVPLGGQCWLGCASPCCSVILARHVSHGSCSPGDTSAIHIWITFLVICETFTHRSKITAYRGPLVSVTDRITFWALKHFVRVKHFCIQQKSYYQHSHSLPKITQHSESSYTSFHYDILVTTLLQRSPEQWLCVVWNP